MSGRRNRVVVSVLASLAALVLVIAGGVVSCSADDPAPGPALQKFFDGWAAGDLDGVPIESAAGELLAADDVLAQIDELAGDLDPRRVIAQAAAEPHVEDGRATSTVNVEWSVADGVVWPYQTTVQLHLVDGAWRVVFTPATVYHRLTAGAHLETRFLPATRGSITDGADEPIVSERPVVTVGVEPRRVTDQAALIAALGAALASIGVSVDLTDLPARLAAANPDAFVEVVTLRQEAYLAIRDRIHDLPGTVFREGTLPLAPSRRFARALLGTVGEVTREQLDQNPGRYVAGEMVGQSGLQELYDDVLRGRPGAEVWVAGSEDDPLFHADPRPGGALRTTLDQRVQEAAEEALAGTSQRSALVAVRVSDGAILAVANGPDGGDLNLAFTAQVPPGSTFKMVSALGLLGAGLTPQTPVQCPASYTVDGRTFTNSGGMQLGSVPLRTAFARSCNTAFAALAPQLGVDGLARAAASLGIGTTWDLGVPVFTGSVGTHMSSVEAAAAAFGQGTTLVSPVSLAAAAATVARGAWRMPKLFPQSPAGAPAPVPGVAGDAPDEDAALPNQVALATMMREVVTAGTATALADVPGPPVYAKTGTAEFDNTTTTHAWTIGWQGDIAFAVFVENGGGGSATAVPIVETFLRGLVV